MSTRSALFAQNEDGTYQRLYCHFDGYPSHMLPALAAHDPQDIIDAREIRAITPERISAFEAASSPETVNSTELPEWADYGYLITPSGWTQIHDRRNRPAH